jgi:hypothetical protein
MTAVESRTAPEAGLLTETIAPDPALTLGEIDLAPTELAPGELAGGEPAVRPRPRRRWWRRRRVPADLAAVGLYLLLAGFVTGRLWVHIRGYVLSDNATDQTQFEYFLRHAVLVVTRGQTPFFTGQLNAPDGVNLMANTATFGLTVPLVPVTMLLGPQVSFAIMVAVGLAATATAWYWLFSRHLVSNRIAAAVAGAFCGFAPGMISQANGHPNISAQFLLPMIFWRVTRLREPGRVLRNGLILGLLIAYQTFINEETLFLSALASGLFVLVWALRDRAAARRDLPMFLRGLGVAAGLAVVLLAYPLYVQFFGPQHYAGMNAVVANYGTDPVSLYSFSRQSFAGPTAIGNRLAPNPSEENAFFGVPLVILVGLLFMVYRKHRVARTAAIVGLVFLVLSLGARLSIGDHHTKVPGPYLPLTYVPLFASVITTRLVLVVVPVIAVLLALWLEAVLAKPPGGRLTWSRGRVTAMAVVVIALVPLLPRQLPISTPAPVPTFFTSGAWRGYVPDGWTVVTVPPTSLADAMEGMRWATDQHLEVKLAGGYFLGPDAHGVTIFGAPPRPTTRLLDGVNRKGRLPDIGADNRAAALADLRFWRAAIVVLDPAKKYENSLWLAVTALLGITPRLVGGVWLWDVRPLVGK